MKDITKLLDELRAIAQEGLTYSQTEYDTDRYQKLLDITSGEYAAMTGLSAAEIKQIFLRDEGIITPKVGIDIPVINDKNEILVLRREGNGMWGMPGGWADIDEAPFDTAVRETFEEAGITVEPTGYIGIASKQPRTFPGWTDGLVSQVNICVAVKPIPATSKITLSHEHTAYKWITSVHEISAWNIAHKPAVEQAFGAYRRQAIIPSLDSRETHPV